MIKFSRMILVIIVASVFSISTPVLAKTAWSTPNANGKNDMHLYFYWSKDCPHCKVALPFMQKMSKKHSWLKLHTKEVSTSRKNIVEFSERAKEIGEQAELVPAFFFCGQMFTGYGDNATTGQWIIDTIAECRVDPAGYLRNNNFQ